MNWRDYRRLTADLLRQHGPSPACLPGGTLSLSSVGLEINILGPLEAQSSSGPVRFGSAKERALLVLLAVEVGQVVSNDRLLEDLWEGAPPGSELGALRVLVSRLRKTLARQGSSPDAILTRPMGYLMSTEVSVDARVFTDLAASGHRRLTAGEPELASRILGEALALWRTQELTQFPGEAGRLGMARLEQLRLNALEWRIEANLECGQSTELLGELQELTETHPFHERFWAARIISLYRAGRQAEALRTYGALRALLRDELGIDPSPELRQLEAAVLTQDDSLLTLVPAHWRINRRTTEPTSGYGPRPGGDVTTMSLPKRLVREPKLGFVGRAAERQRLLETITARAVTSESDTLLITGEAGIGKTSLIADAARAGNAGGAGIIYGRCDEDLVIPYQPFVEALSGYFGGVSDDSLLAHDRSQLAELSRLVPEIRQRNLDLRSPTLSEPEVERHLLFAAVVAVLSDIADKSPLVVILEDLHWADRPTLQLLRHIAGSHQRNWSIVGSFRNTELSSSHSLLGTLAALRRNGPVENIDLSGLNDAEIISLLEAAFGHALDHAGMMLAQTMRRETDGNPFFVSEILLHLLDTGSISQGAEGLRLVSEDIARLGVPASIREVVGARIARLGPVGEVALSLASTIGDEFDLDLLAVVTNRSDEEVLRLLQGAAEADLVRESPDFPNRYNFVHALIRQTFYLDMGAAQRARAHRQVAEGLEVICGADFKSRAGELAHHWTRATQPVDVGKAIRYSRLAGDVSLTALAPDEAVSYYTQALELLMEMESPDPREVVDLETWLGTAQRQTGDPAYRSTLLDAAHRAAQLNDTERLVAAALANDRGFYTGLGAVDVDKVETLETALDRLSPDHSGRALVLACLCQELTYAAPLDRRMALANEALAMVRKTGDDAAIVRVLTHISGPLLVPSRVAVSTEWSSESLKRARSAGDPLLLFWAAARRVSVVAWRGDVEEWDRCLAIEAAIVERIDQPILKWVHSAQWTTRALFSGDTESAEERAAMALQAAPSASATEALTWFGIHMMTVSWQRGAWVSLLPLIEKFVETNPGAPGSEPVLAAALAEGGRIDEALHRLEEFASGGFELPPDPTWFIGMVSYADVAIVGRAREFAEVLFERLAPWADLVSYIDVTTLGPISLYLGGLADVLGKLDEADAYFASCAHFCHGAGAKFFAAQTDLAWGKMLATRSLPRYASQARTLLDKAHTAAKANGYEEVERQAAAALGAVG